MVVEGYVESDLDFGFNCYGAGIVLAYLKLLFYCILFHLQEVLLPKIHTECLRVYMYIL